MAFEKPLIIILGDQLFPIEHLAQYKNYLIFMKEDYGLCTHYKHHKQKILFFLESMRHYKSQLTEKGFDVHYQKLKINDPEDYVTSLKSHIKRHNIDKLIFYEINDRFMRQEIDNLAKTMNLEKKILPSPSFMTKPDEREELFDGQKFKMNQFYIHQRKKLDLLIENQKPLGGKWSFDKENRKKFPKNLTPPDPPKNHIDSYSKELLDLVSTKFNDHFGGLDEIIWPIGRAHALDWINNFFEEKLELFGPYEDAITTRSYSLYHSLLSPLMNLGVITPEDILKKTRELIASNNFNLSSLEGFIRQVFGWREFIHGVYQSSSYQNVEQFNFWGHTNKLNKLWDEGQTGILPLDESVHELSQYAWTHHINRLMVLANIMNLTGIKPNESKKWFMEKFIDSADWVMDPNVYGMGLFADGGIFASKPYICGSNYILKMSDYPKGEWCEILDALYWRFILVHDDFFLSQPRMSMMARLAQKFSVQKKSKIISIAESFIEKACE